MIYSGSYNNPANHSDHLRVLAYQKAHNGVLPGADAVNSSLDGEDERTREDRAALSASMFARLGTMAHEVIELDYNGLSTPKDRVAAWNFLDGPVDAAAYQPRIFLQDGYSETVGLDDIGQPAW